MKHPQATPCCPLQIPGWLDVLWGYTDGMKAPARFWRVSVNSSVCFQCCHLFGFARLFCSDVLAVTAAEGKLLLLPLGCVEEPCCCCWVDWERWAHCRTGTGPHCATRVWGSVQMGALSWELEPGGAVAVGISGYTAQVSMCWDRGQHRIASILLPCPSSLPGPFVDTTKEVFVLFMPLQYFSTIFCTYLAVLQPGRLIKSWQHFKGHSCLGSSLIFLSGTEWFRAGARRLAESLKCWCQMPEALQPHTWSRIIHSRTVPSTG